MAFPGSPLLYVLLVGKRKDDRVRRLREIFFLWHDTYIIIIKFDYNLDEVSKGYMKNFNEEFFF